MKKFFFMAFVFAIGSAPVIAQDTTTFKAGWGTLNYAVPESPAFKILGTSPSNIMRPTATRDIAFSIGNYFVTNGASIPQNLAVELSASAFNPNVSLKKFQDNAFLYTSALSIGTKVNSDKSYAIGLGLKFRILDQQDLRLDKTFETKIRALAIPTAIEFSKAISDAALKRFANDNSKKYREWFNYLTDAYNNTSDPNHTAVAKEIDAEIAKTVDETAISKLRDEEKKSNWNKATWYVGVATLFNSKDSLLSHIQGASKIGLWTTAGIPLFKDKGQLLIGITGQCKDTTNSKLGVQTLNLGTRAYYGSNDLKAFVEANTLFASSQKTTYKASVGVETTFFGGMWLDFSLGLSKQGDAKMLFTPGFNIFFANGEKKISGN